MRTRAERRNRIKTHMLWLSLRIVNEKQQGISAISEPATGQRRVQLCEHRFLLLVEANSTKFLPVADQLIFHDNLMDGQLALSRVSVEKKSKCTDQLTSRSDSIGA